MVWWKFPKLRYGKYWSPNSNIYKIPSWASHHNYTWIRRQRQHNKCESNQGGVYTNQEYLLATPNKGDVGKPSVHAKGRVPIGASLIYLSSQSVIRLWFSNIFVIRSKKDNCLQVRAAIRRNDLWPFRLIEGIKVMAPSLRKSSNYRQMNNQSCSLCILVTFLLANEPRLVLDQSSNPWIKTSW